MDEITLFRGVSVELLNQVATTERHIKKGVTVYNKGDSCTGLDILLSGSLGTYMSFDNGSQIQVLKFDKNRIIGANMLFGNMTQYPYNIFCVEDCRLLHIEKSEVEKLLHDYRFTLNFLECISLNSETINQKLNLYTNKSLRLNILDYLKSLRVEQGSNPITLPISKKQLADHFGVQRPSLFRELKQMQDKGIIKVDNRKIYILEENFYSTSSVC